MTWNLLHGLDPRTGVVDVAAVAACLEQFDADVVALQEVDRGLARSGRVDQVRALAERLGLHHAFAPSLIGDPDVRWTRWPDGQPDNGAAGYGVGLLSRHPIVGTRRIPLPGGGDGERPGPRTVAQATAGSPAAATAGAAPPSPGWDREPRVALVARVAAHGRRLTVVATHLSYLPWRGVRQLTRLLRTLRRETGPVIVLGDLNLPGPVVSAVARGRQRADGEPTYPAPAPRLQLDHILVRGARITSVEVVDAGPSDHRPVIADLVLPGD